MAWFKVDDRFHDHPKTEDLTLAAVGLWTLAGAWSASNLTDGQVSRTRVIRLGGDETLAAELVRAGLWEEIPDGYAFYGWDEYQPTRAEVESRREQDRQKKRAQRRGPRGTWIGREGESRSVSPGVSPGVSPSVSPDMSPDVSPGDTPGDTPGESRGESPGVSDRPDPTRPDPTPKNPSRPPAESASGAAAGYSEEFERFWQAWPRERRVSKRRAATKFAAALKRATAEEIIAGAAQYAADPNRPSGAEAKFIPHPATWLEQDRWADGPLPPRAGGSRSDQRLARAVDIARGYAANPVAMFQDPYQVEADGPQELEQ